MVAKAIVEKIMPDGYHVKVRIPVLHKIKDAPGATSFKELPEALINYAPGCKPNFSVGDIVYVAFENNQISEPVIIGALFKGKIDISCSLLTDSIMYVDNEVSSTVVNNQGESSTSISNYNTTINNDIDLSDEEYLSLLVKLENPSSLTNTTWYMNETLNFIGVENTEFILTGLCGSIDMDQLAFEKSTSDRNILFINTTQEEPVYWEDTGWFSDNLRRIAITGGTDADNSDLIEWFINNGRLIVI